MHNFLPLDSFAPPNPRIDQIYGSFLSIQPEMIDGDSIERILALNLREEDGFPNDFMEDPFLATCCFFLADPRTWKKNRGNKPLHQLFSKTTLDTDSLSSCHQAHKHIRTSSRGNNYLLRTNTAKNVIRITQVCKSGKTLKTWEAVEGTKELIFLKKPTDVEQFIDNVLESPVSSPSSSGSDQSAPSSSPDTVPSSFKRTREDSSVHELEEKFSVLNTRFDDHVKDTNAKFESHDKRITNNEQRIGNVESRLDTSTAIHILKFLHQNLTESFSSIEIRRKLNLTEGKSEVNRILYRELKEKGLVEQSNGTPPDYKITQKGREELSKFYE